MVGDGEAALQAIAETSPDVIILDLRMPVRDGLSTITAMRDAGDMRPVIILATQVDDDVFKKLLCARANAVLHKNGPEARLFDAIEAVGKDVRLFDADLLDRLIAAPASARPASPFDSLSTREREIAREAAKGLSNREIADRLNVTEGTVKVYLHNIFAKLGIKKRGQLALLAHQTAPN